MHLNSHTQLQRASIVVHLGNNKEKNNGGEGGEEKRKKKRHKPTGTAELADPHLYSADISWG